jgi:hypothetical protein
VVDAALTEACLAVQESTIPDYDVGGVVRGPSGTRLEGIAPSNIYRSADGSWVVIAANQDTVFRRLCAAMGQPELATDDRFVDHVARGRNQDELDKIIGDWAAQRQPDDIIETLSAAGVISGPINTVAEVVRDPQLRARRMLVEHYDERIGRNVLGPGVIPVLSRPPAVCATPARPGPASTTPRCTAICWGWAPTRSPTSRPGGAVSALPEHVTIREVALRDGLQIETPIPLAAKLELLAAIAATGVREVEATAFVSPSKVPALADAPEFSAQLAAYPDIEFSALVASPNGARRAIAAGLHSLEYVVSAADGHSNANVGRSSAEATAQIAEIVAIAHDAGVSVEVIIATAWDCPFDGPPAPAGARHRRCRGRLRRRPAGHRRHHRHRNPGRVTALVAAVRPRTGELPLGRTSTTPAAPDWPARTPPSPRASPGWTPRSAGWVAARSPPAPAATSPPRIWCTCCGTAASPSTSTCRRDRCGAGWPSAWSATTCPARCCVPATGSRADRPCPPQPRCPARAARPAGPSRTRPGNCSPNAVFTAPRWPISPPPR